MHDSVGQVVLDRAGLVAEQTVEDVASERHADRRNLLGKDKTLAEVAAVVLGEEQAVQDRQLLGHLAERVQGRHVLALVHALDHPLEGRDHIQVHLRLGGNGRHRAAVIFELGFFTEENARLRSLEEFGAHGESGSSEEG